MVWEVLVANDPDDRDALNYVGSRSNETAAWRLAAKELGRRPGGIGGGFHGQGGHGAIDITDNGLRSGRVVARIGRAIVRRG